MFYIVSGLERSGTSLMMQMLHAGGAPVAFDDSRPADEHNPRGYFELYGGKIARRLSENPMLITQYEGKVIKVTAYGLQFLPLSQQAYNIIFMQRNYNEILRSLNKMSPDIDIEEDRSLFEGIEQKALNLIAERKDMDMITIDHKALITYPEECAPPVARFLGLELDIAKMVEVVDPTLWRNRG